MTGRRPSLYWRVTWKVVSPLLLLTIFVAYIAVLVWTPLSYRAWNTQYVGPLGEWGATLGLTWPFPVLPRVQMMSQVTLQAAFAVRPKAARPPVSPGGTKANSGRDLGQGLSQWQEDHSSFQVPGAAHTGTWP